MLTYDRFTADFREDVIIERLQEKGLLRSFYNCDCGSQMTIVRCADYRDDIIFRCPSCWKKKSARLGTFFARSKLRLRQIMLLVANWIIKAPVTLAATFADVSEVSAVQWYEFCRDICATKLTSVQQLYGGVGNIVEIDETVVRKRKYNRGRCIKEDWVSTSSINIPHRSLEYMIDHYRKDTSKESGTGRHQQSYRLYSNMCCRALLFIQMIGERTGV